MPHRRILLTLLPLLALAGCTPDPSPAPAGSEPPAAVPAGSEPAAVPVASAGEQAAWDRLVEPCEPGELVVVQAVTMADVTADGTADAVVARACEGTTEYGPSRVEVFDGTSPVTRPRRLGTLLGDAGADRPYVDAVSWADGAVLIRANGVDETSDATCPEVIYTYRYTYAAGAFRQVGRSQKPDETCGPG